MYVTEDVGLAEEASRCSEGPKPAAIQSGGWGWCVTGRFIDTTKYSTSRIDTASKNRTQQEQDRA